MMFLESFLLGLKTFLFPSVLLLTLGLLILNGVYLGFIRRVTRSVDTQEAAGPGCLIPLVGLLFQGLLMAIFVLYLIPVLTGPPLKPTWALVEPMGFVAARAGIFATLTVTLLSFIPFLGKFLASSPGIEAFLLGTITFRFLSPAYLEALLGKLPSWTPFFPGVWESLGYLLLALLFTRLMMVPVYFLDRALKSSAFTLKVLGPTLDIFGGVLAFFMYTGYVRLGVINYG